MPPTPSPTEIAYIARLRRVDPPLYRLALVLAPALRIEPLLLRNARQRFVPGSDAALEARLWFAPLIANRGPDAVLLRAGLAAVLWDQLDQDPARAATVQAFIARHTAHWSAPDRLEQTLRAAARQRDPAPLRAGLQAALRRLAEAPDAAEGRERARWARGLLPLLPNTADPAPSDPALAGLRHAIALYIGTALGDVGGGLGARLTANGASEALPGWLTRGLADGPSQAIGLNLRPGLLECVAAGAGAHDLPLPGTLPALVHLQPWGADPGGAPGRWETLQPGRRVPLPPHWHDLILTTATGSRARLRARAPVPVAPAGPDAAAAVLVIHQPQDAALADQLVALLAGAGLRAQALPETGALAAPDPRRLALRLWSRHSARHLGAAALAEAPGGPGLLVRVDDSPWPEGLGDGEAGREGTDWLDLRGWRGDALDPRGQALLARVRRLTGPVYSPQVAALLAELADLKTPPERRLVIGDELAALGDPRPGVGLRADGLPDLDWVAIPAGRFRYGEAKAQRETAAFEIARYPITHAQYQAFIDAGGYREARWWAGLAKRIDQPSDPRWSQPNRPRDTVTWYEAVAFTRWLSAVLGEQIRLPTEWEWERAARGTDGREYPWGDGYRVGHANVDETQNKDGPTSLGQTTAVGMYPQGASPEGVLDLAGNVWEWCLNSRDQPAFTDTTTDTPRVLRGGAWFFSSRHARAALRFWNLPDSRVDGRGLRVLRGSPIGL